MKSISRLFLIALVLTPFFANAGVEPKATMDKEMGAVVSSFITAEESQDYNRIYLLLSRRMKKQLLRENAVKNAKDYMKLRYSSEARWFDFSEAKRSMQAKMVTISFNVTVEESGENERVPLTVRLIFENERWHHR